MSVFAGFLLSCSVLLLYVAVFSLHRIVGRILKLQGEMNNLIEKIIDHIKIDE